MSYTAEHNEAIREQARDWVLELSSGDVAGDELLAFQAWIEADQRHKQAFNESQRVWDGLSDVSFADRELPAETLLERYAVRRERTGLRQWLKERFKPVVWTGGAVVAGALLAVFLLPHVFTTQPASQAELFTTRTAEIRDIELDDGSVITLGTKSGMIVDFDEHQRRIQLVNGEAFFDVSKDPERPFVVDFRGTEIRVLGTRFDVREGAAQLRITVLDGLIEVAPEIKSSTARLSAGQQVKVLSTGEMTAVGSVTGDKPGDWRLGRLFYEGEYLREVIADANRYHEEKIILMPPSLGDLKVTASFDTERIDQMLNTLQLALPIEVSRLKGGTAILIKQAIEK